MTRRKLEVATEDRDPAICIFRLSGNLYGDPEGYAFQTLVREKFNAGTKGLVIDLGDVDRIDSSGVGILASITVSAQNAGAGVVLASLSTTVEKVLEIAWFQRWADHAGSVDEALKKLAAMGDPSKGS